MVETERSTLSSPEGPAYSNTPFVERVFSPLYRFAGVASSGGMVLLAAIVVALVWANSPWADVYHHLWETPIGFSLGERSFNSTVHHLINDGLMAVFFFLVGLEIKREVLAGELSSARTAALPMIAALGGMIVPALIYAAMNAGSESARGWGVPMATDIAFALGVLALLGSRVPVGLKVFLAALAIVDDLGAVAVIAVFYSAGLDWTALGVTAGLLILAALANASGLRRPWAYGLIGLALWGAVMMSGVHATVAGVLLALVIPVRTRLYEAAFLTRARRALEDFDAAAQVTARDPDTTVLSNKVHHAALDELETLAEQAQPPLISIEHSLHGVVAFGIMPLFALANAGVTMSSDAALVAASSPVALGILLGLVLGKPLGIVGFSWLAVRLGIAGLPSAVSWPMVAGAGVLGGIGFTMALFIAGLAFTTTAMLDVAKLGIFVASAISGVVGWLLLRRAIGERSRVGGSDVAVPSAMGTPDKAKD